MNENSSDKQKNLVSLNHGPVILSSSVPISLTFTEKMIELHDGSGNTILSSSWGSIMNLLSLRPGSSIEYRPWNTSGSSGSPPHNPDLIIYCESGEIRIRLGGMLTS